MKLSIVNILNDEKFYDFYKAAFKHSLYFLCIRIEPNTHKHIDLRKREKDINKVRKEVLAYLSEYFGISSKNEKTIVALLMLQNRKITLST